MRLRQPRARWPPSLALRPADRATKNFLCKTFRGELGLRDESRRARPLHFLGVAQLVAIGGGAEGDEDGGASGRRDFRGRDGARAADDQIGLGKSLRHVPDEGQYLRVDFTPRIGHAHGIIIALAGLMDDRDAVLFAQPAKSAASTKVRLMTSAPWLPPVIRIWNGSDGARAGDREKFRAHGNSRQRRLAPQSFVGAS
jgi:hypothetical protein